MVYPDSPALLTADQFEVLAQVGTIAEETYLDDLHRKDAVPGDMCCRRKFRGIGLAGGRHAPPGQGAGVSRHHTLSTQAHPDTHGMYATVSWHGLLSHLATPFPYPPFSLMSMKPRQRMEGCNVAGDRQGLEMTAIKNNQTGFDSHLRKPSTCVISLYSPPLQLHGQARQVY